MHFPHRQSRKWYTLCPAFTMQSGTNFTSLWHCKTDSPFWSERFRPKWSRLLASAGRFLSPRTGPGGRLPHTSPPNLLLWALRAAIQNFLRRERQTILELSACNHPATRNANRNADLRAERGTKREAEREIGREAIREGSRGKKRGGEDTGEIKRARKRVAKREAKSEATAKTKRKLK